VLLQLRNLALQAPQILPSSAVCSDDLRQTLLTPPSTTMSEPVMNELSSEARKRAAADLAKPAKNDRPPSSKFLPVRFSQVVADRSRISDSPSRVVAARLCL